MIRLRLAAALAVLGAAVAVLLLPLPLPHNAITVALEDAGHLPLVFGLCLLLLWVLAATALTLRARLLIALAAGVFFGVATELLQSLTGRDASWLDLRSDSLGALGAVAAWWLWSQWRAQGPRRASAQSPATTVLALATLAITAVFWLLPLGQALLALRERIERFPVLFAADFRQTQFFVHAGGSMARPLVPVLRDGQWVLPLHCGATRYSGIAMDGLPRDWSAWQSLRIDVSNPTDAPFDLGIHVRGIGRKLAYDERFNIHLTLRPRETRQVLLPLQKIARGPRGMPLDLSRIWSIGIFCAGEARDFELLRVALQ